MAVRVVRPDRDECDAGAAGGEEVGVGVGAAVVRHLEDVGAQVDAVPDQPGLGLGTEIAGQQGGDAPDGQPGHHRQIVGCRRRGRPGRGGGEDLDPYLPDRAPIARDEHLPARAGAGDEPLEGADPVVGR